MRRAVRGAVVAAVAVTLLGGCAVTAPPTAEPTTTTSSPAPSPSPSPAVDPVVAAVTDMTTAERAASVVMGHLPTTDPAALHEFMGSGPDGAPLGGFILMGANVAGDAARLKAVTDALILDDALPPLIAIDQEGGDVSRLPWDRLPGGRALQAHDAAQTRDVFAQRARMIADVGANVNFGIVADVPRDPSSFIAARALGTDPEVSAARVTAAVEGESGTVLSTIKHFPGHGAAPGDSHRSIPATAETLQQWRSADAVPFAAGIDAGAELLMFGHLVYSAVDPAPASLSARWHAIARDELGFDGVMVTDDLGMLSASGVDAYRDPVANGVAAIAAGNDMVLMVAGSTEGTASELATGIARAVEEGTLPAQRLQDAAEHVMALRMRLAAATAP